jgi:signal transduction histidine kinase
MSNAADLKTKRFEETSDAEARSVIGIDPDVVATLAHEIRNILSPLGSSLELLNMATLDEITASQARGIIGRQFRQLQRLVNDLLDAYRIEHRHIQIIPRLTELSHTLESICQDHRPIFASRGITLTLDAATEPVWLDIDAERLDQALTNLLSNSLKFTDCGGIVRVGLNIDAARKYATISVTDTGLGIEPAVLHAIFDPQSHDNSCRNASGLGLGLPLVKRLVELHGGHVAAHSDGLGKGAEFRILLPLPSVG